MIFTLILIFLSPFQSIINYFREYFKSTFYSLVNFILNKFANRYLF